MLVVMRAGHEAREQLQCMRLSSQQGTRHLRKARWLIGLYQELPLSTYLHPLYFTVSDRLLIRGTHALLD